MSDQITVFDRSAVRRHRERAAPVFRNHAFLHDEVADRLVERLEDVTRTFPLTLDLGAHDGTLSRLLTGRQGIETVISTDLSPAMASAAPAPGVVCDEEFLPFADGCADLIVSNLSLHWVNDLPGALIQARRTLKPDGLFLGAMLGGETLKELRGVLTAAEVELEGGLSPRISPFVSVRDAGMLLNRAGFALPVVDCDTITVSYEHPLQLMADLRGMGETNAVTERRKGFSRRATLSDAFGRYMEDHADDEGRITATFQIIWLHAWAPHASQPQPKKPGSATHSLADALDPLKPASPPDTQ